MTVPRLRGLNIFLNVVGALILRDIKSRAGPYYTGFLIVILVPFLHVAVITTLFVLIGKTVPTGGDYLTFFGLSILPFVIWLYPARNIAISIGLNRPLLYFPRVRILDIVLARGIVEIFAGLVSCMSIILLIFIGTGQFTPVNALTVVQGIVLSLYLGFAFGYLNALLAQLFHFWPFVFSLFAPIVWMASGIIFHPSALPEPYKNWLYVNPLLHCVEIIRNGYYLDYQSPFLDAIFVFLFGTTMIAIALVSERIGRRIILES